MNPTPPPRVSAERLSFVPIPPCPCAKDCGHAVGMHWVTLPDGDGSQGAIHCMACECESLRSQVAALRDALVKLHDTVSARPAQPAGTHGAPHSWWTLITHSNLDAQRVLHDTATAAAAHDAEIESRARQGALEEARERVAYVRRDCVRIEAEMSVIQALEQAEVELQALAACPPETKPVECSCRHSDAWRCARDGAVRRTIACQCECHRPPETKPVEPISNERAAVMMRWQEFRAVLRVSELADEAAVTFVLRECRLAERAVRPPETKQPSDV